MGLTRLLHDLLSLPLLAMHPNIHIRLFNPSLSRVYRGLEFITDFSRMNHRMHNKSLTVDNLATMVGGRNIGNEYFSNNDEVEFGDFDLLAIGKAVDEVSNQFDLYWNADVSYRTERLAFESNAYLGRLELSPFLEKLREQKLKWYWGKAEVVFDPPQRAQNKDEQLWLLSDLSQFLESAEEEVMIIPPYFVPTAQSTQDLVAAAQSGLRITMVTNSLAAIDVLAIHAGYQGYRKTLLDGGVTIFVGSFNFDPRSAWINTEMGMIFHQPEFANGVATGIEAGLEASAFRLDIEGGRTCLA